jgi:hypothetical protein
MTYYFIFDTSSYGVYSVKVGNSLVIDGSKDITGPVTIKATVAGKPTVSA